MSLLGLPDAGMLAGLHECDIMSSSCIKVPHVLHMGIQITLSP